MRTFKSLALLALLFCLSLAVFADTSTDATHGNMFMYKYISYTIQGRRGGGGGGGYCQYGCCGGWWNGRCRYCCRRSQAVEPEAFEPEAVEANVVDPQQGFGGGGRRGGGGGGGGYCQYGCCGGWWNGRCRYCCRRPQAVEPEAEAVEANVVDPQQGFGGGGRRGGGGGGRRGGGCWYGCCGWWHGRCSYCCRSQAEANEVMETVESQPMATEGENKKEESKP
ncbi:hypothetical protein CARUB_v10024716mg [Capsella rubella]|uniref:Glycine-rich protein n=1 Tax=Capsella rubella TaxID=81985 RepID=R0FZI5_9BRAS|nr:hypothetical protein CARUB_v10024716mg [Capsella rubella]